MKKISLVLVVLAMTMTGFKTMAQESESGGGIIKMYEGMYRLASRFGDEDMSKTALYHLLMLTSNKSAILDSLSLHYYGVQQWASVALVSKENIKINPDNQLALELAAVSFEQLGLDDRALENYETLFLKNNSSSTLYRIAFLQYSTKKYKEVDTSINILLNREDIVEQKLLFPTQDKKQQEVSMKAAVLNLKGLVSKAQGNIQKAKEFFLEALNEAPGFEVAQINLRDASK